ncbi:alpha/beta hydrolase [Pikeienuella piscinae]|uniref:Alpha/beta hydrolase n=1 Tax=Pikeienuella piscinae TaxID=2748098 RepID=A0A7L5BVU9_9RHOB|nr:alpha/beta fold hydrolase [Pikeienuella piscinae]QIE55233.1 alpha/beta hydrolase [Pikeienuella piscinae]
MHENVSFHSEGAEIRGRNFSHGDPLRPIVVMTHGTTATITMAIDLYAARIFEAGYDVLLYDHRNFGKSGGEPRQEINPWIQARGYRDAVAFLRNRAASRRIVLWGDSFSAGLALVAGALIDDISAIVAQIPVCGASVPETDFGAGAFNVMKKIFEDGDVEGGPEQTTGPIPVVSSDQINNPSLLAPIQAYRWFIEHGGRHGSGWENRATRVIPDLQAPCSPFVTARHLDMPVQMMVGEADEMVHCNLDAQKAVFERIPGEKEFVEIPGGHFGLLWHPSDEFEAAVNAQIVFLKKALPTEA